MGPPEGSYFYEVPVMYQRPGCTVEIDSVEIRFPAPLDGPRYKTLAGVILEYLKQQAPDLPGQRAGPFAPYFLGFVSQEELDRQDAERLTTTGATAGPALELVQ